MICSICKKEGHIRTNTKYHMKEEKIINKKTPIIIQKMY